MDKSRWGGNKEVTVAVQALLVDILTVRLLEHAMPASLKIG